MVTERKLRGSMLLEALVASVIFMLVFVLSLDSLAKLGSIGGRGDDRLKMEADGKACMDEFISQHRPAGEYLRKYEWGEIRINIAPYPEFGDLFEVTFEMVPDGIGREIKYKRLK